MSLEKGGMEAIAAAEEQKKEAKESPKEMAKEVLSQILELRLKKISLQEELDGLQAIDMTELAEKTGKLTKEEKVFYKRILHGLGVGKDKPIGTPESETAGKEINRIVGRVWGVQGELRKLARKERELEKTLLSVKMAELGNSSPVEMAKQIVAQEDASALQQNKIDVGAQDVFDETQEMLEKEPKEIGELKEGDKVKVLRSSGEVESGWEVLEINKEGGIVKVLKNEVRGEGKKVHALTKTLKLEDLNTWNKDDKLSLDNFDKHRVDLEEDDFEPHSIPEVTRGPQISEDELKGLEVKPLPEFVDFSSSGTSVEPEFYPESVENPILSDKEIEELTLKPMPEPVDLPPPAISIKTKLSPKPVEMPSPLDDLKPLPEFVDFPSEEARKNYAKEEEIMEVTDDMKIPEDESSDKEIEKLKIEPLEKEEILDALSDKLTGQTKESIYDILERIKPDSKILNDRNVLHMARVLLVDRLQHPTIFTAADRGLRDAVAIFKKFNFPKVFLENPVTQKLVKGALVQDLQYGNVVGWKERAEFLLSKCGLSEEFLNSQMVKEVMSKAIFSGLEKGVIFAEAGEDEKVLDACEDVARVAGLPEKETIILAAKSAAMASLFDGKIQNYERITGIFNFKKDIKPEELKNAAQFGVLNSLKEGRPHDFAQIVDKFPEIAAHLESEEAIVAAEEAIAWALSNGDLEGALLIHERAYLPEGHLVGGLTSEIKNHPEEKFVHFIKAHPLVDEIIKLRVAEGKYQKNVFDRLEDPYNLKKREAARKDEENKKKKEEEEKKRKKAKAVSDKKNSAAGALFGRT